MNEIVVDSRYYEILGVPKTATPVDLKRAYRTAAFRNHPDKGGDPEKFKDLARAYEVLSDPEKREIYNAYGEDALKEGTGGGGMRDPFDMFLSIFGRNPFGGGGGSSARRRRRGEDVVHQLKVSLEELYAGTTKKLSVSRNVICSQCDGRGSQPGDPIRCVQCNGSGKYVIVRQVGANSFRQRIILAENAKGTGKFIYHSILCPQCKGDKVVQEKKILEVHVEKGMQNGQKVTFPGEADEAPDTVAGGIVFVLEEMSILNSRERTTTFLWSVLFPWLRHCVDTNLY